MTRRQKGLTYLVVGPFAIVLAFPFYFALVTMFKSNLDLSNVEHSPYLYHDPEGNLGLGLLERRDDRPRPGSSSRTRTTRRGSSTRSSSAWPSSESRCSWRCRPATHSPGSPAGWGQTAGVGHLPRLPDSADAPLPAALADRHQPRPEGLAVGADPRVPVVHDPVRDVAPDGVLQDDSAGARGRRARRRLLAAQGALPDRPPDLAAGDPHRRHLRLLALRQRVHLRVHVHLDLRAADRVGRNPERPHPRRRLLLAVAAWQRR